MEGLIHLETHRTQMVQSKLRWGFHGSNFFRNFPPNLDRIGIWGIWRPGRCLEPLVTFFGAFLGSSCSLTGRTVSLGAYLVWVVPRTMYHATLQKLFWNGLQIFKTSIWLRDLLEQVWSMEDPIHLKTHRNKISHGQFQDGRNPWRSYVQASVGLQPSSNHDGASMVWTCLEMYRQC